MASIEANGSRGHHKFTLNVSETYVSGGAENYSTVSWSLVLSPIQSGWDWYISGVNYSVNVDGQNWSGSIPSYNGSSTVTIASGTKNVTHDSDGGKWVGFDFSINDTAGQYYTPGNASASGGMWLTKINRYANITSLTISDRKETSLKVNVATDRNAWIFAKVNNGAWLNGGEPFLSNVTSGSFTLTGLTANTNYTVTVLARSDGRYGSLDTTKDVATSTYNYPNCNSSPNFIIGYSVTLGLYNPLKRSVTVKILSSNDTELASGTTSGTSISGFNGASQIQNMYNSIPNSASGTYKVRVIYGSTSTKTRNNGNTYSVNTTTSKPTFNLFEYEDINPTTLALTGNNQTCVLGYSTIKATVSTSNKATANNSATMSKYRLTIGSATNEANYSESEAVTMQIASATSSSYVVYAIDSRGLSTDVTLTSPIQIPYTNIIKDVSNSSTLRNGGVSEFVTLTLNGSIWMGNFGQVDNAITSTTYRFKKSSDTTWITGTTTITPTLNQDGTFEFEGLIAGNNEDNGFDIDSVYNIEVTVADKLSSTTYTFTLGSGIPHVAYYKDGVSIMGAYDEDLGGALQVNGVIRDGVYSYEERKVGYWINGKPLYAKTLESDTTGTISNNIDNVDEIFIDMSHSYLKANNIYYPISYKLAQNYSGVPTISSFAAKTFVNVHVIGISDINLIIVTILYTKTTDTATITSE